MSHNDECRALGRLLNPTEQLLCVAAAVHRNADGQRTQAIWLGVGKIQSRNEYAVFLFTRAGFACLRQLQEWIYCVLPVVANIRVDIGLDHCCFTWSPGVSRLVDKLGLQRDPLRVGDCVVELAGDGAQVLARLEDAHREACARGLVFHEEQRANHRELWRYQAAMPVDLARLPSAAAAVPGFRRTKASLREGASVNSHNAQLLCLTWNVGASLPQDGQGLEPVLKQEPLADLVCVGLQETCELSARRLIADGDEWFAWRAWAENEVNDFYRSELELLAYSHLVGMLILVFARSTLRDQISDIRSTAIGLGVGGYGGNKGAVSVRFDLGSTSFCFVNAHLASGQEHYIERCQHFNTIMQRIVFQEELDADEEDPLVRHARSMPDECGHQAADVAADTKKSLSFAEKRATAQGTYKIDDHDHIFWVGDTNSRLHWPSKLGGMPIQDAMRKVQERRMGELLALDQLNLMRRDGLAFQGFEEHRILFLPSYKWRREGDALDMRSQKHVPAWTDRILFRSLIHPPTSVHRYDMHPGLWQSDHRPVFACATATWNGLRVSEGSQSARGLEEWSEAELLMEPAEVAFKGLKPDQPQEGTVRLVLNGPASARFKVFLRWPEGGLRPLGCGGPWRAGPGHGGEAAGGAAGGAQGAAPAPAPALARWLGVRPAQGTLHRGRPAELRVSACVCEAVPRRRAPEAAVVVRLQQGSALYDFELPVRAQLLPSLLRLPLEALAARGSRPLLSPAPERGGGGAPEEARAVSCLPPKEVMAVMQWVLQQSRDTAPRALDWWPEPLLDGALRGRGELCEVQRYVENGWPLPVGNPQLPARSAALFLLRWLSMLPEPLLAQASAQLFCGSSRSVLEAMPALPRSVLICILALFVQLMARHGARGDVTSRLASCLTQQVRPPGSAEQFLQALMSELAADSMFPPLAALAAAADK